MRGPTSSPAVQSCPRRRAGVACDERTTDAVGNSCQTLRLMIGKRPQIVRKNRNSAVDGGDEKQTLATSAELREALQDIFGIDLSAVSGIDERFDRLA